MKYCSEIASRKIAVLATLATVAVGIVQSNSQESIRTPFWEGNAIAFLQHCACCSFSAFVYAVVVHGLVGRCIW